MGFIDTIIGLLQDPRSFVAAQIAAGPLAAYGFVFLIIFVETGVVFFPFLPGDSLLFVSGFFAQGGGFEIVPLLLTVWVAAILGDQCNFMIGRFLGKRIVDSGKVKAMTPERMEKSEAFLEKWGNLAIFLGRFLPFIRTFVPFLAGMGGMRWRHFLAFNVIGGVCWSSLFVLLGYFFGGIPFVQEHFEMLVVGIIGVSVLPIAIGAVKSAISSRRAVTGPAGQNDSPSGNRHDDEMRDGTEADANEAEIAGESDSPRGDRHTDSEHSGPANDDGGRSPKAFRKPPRRKGMRGVMALMLMAVLLALAAPSVSEADDLVDELMGVQAERSAVSVSLEEKEAETSDTERKLNDLSRRIDEIEKDIRVDRASLAEQMRAAYKTGQVSGWDAVLSADSVEGMLDAAEYSSRIRSQNLANIESVTDSTQELHELRDEADSLYGMQASQRDELRGRLGELDSRIGEMSAQVEVRMRLDRIAIARKAVSLAGTASPEPYIPGGEFEVPTDPRLENYRNEKERVYPGDPWWASCCRVAATAIKASGVDEDWPLGAPADMYAYAANATDKWKMVGTWGMGDSADVLEPGDVLITTGNHIKIFVGNDLVREKFRDSDANMYSGSAGQHQPWCYEESSSYDYREYGIFRYVGLDA